MDIKRFLEGLDKETSRTALIDILSRYTQPAFGALPKRETDILMFEVMRTLGLLPEDASVYDLMTDLRITRAKASQLLFDTAIRKFEDNPALLDAKVVESLCTARFHHDADKYFLLEVEDPMVNAHLKEKVRKAGYISDSSFNSAVIRLPLDAIAGLVSDLVSEERQVEVQAALIKAGAPQEATFKNVIISSLKTLGRKVVGEVANDLVDEAGDYLMPILRNGGTIAGKWLGILGGQGVNGGDAPANGIVAKGGDSHLK